MPRAYPANVLLGKASGALRGWTRFFAGTCGGEERLHGNKAVARLSFVLFCRQEVIIAKSLLVIYLREPCTSMPY